jgi:hypothetical protein
LQEAWVKHGFIDAGVEHGAAKEEAEYHCRDCRRRIRCEHSSRSTRERRSLLRGSFWCRHR